MLNCVKYNNNNYQLDLFDDKIKFLKDYLKDDFKNYETIINDYQKTIENLNTNDNQSGSAEEVQSGEQEKINLKILESSEFQEFAKKELEKNPMDTIENILEYYKKCKQ